LRDADRFKNNLAFISSLVIFEWIIGLGTIRVAFLKHEAKSFGMKMKYRRQRLLRVIFLST
jgi:hypothetical protein